ncbi:MAG: PaaI family thioesterase [Pseudomonadota bacterium]
MSTDFQPVLDPKALHEFLHDAFPQVSQDFEVTELGPGRLTLRLKPAEKHLRPGNTVSGPTLFAMADCAVYLAIIAHVGAEALAVTTNASIDFMRKPAADTDLLANVTLLKLGRGLAVGDVAIRNAGSDIVLARATLTYSRPRA